MALTRPKAAQVNFDVTNITDPLIRINSGQTGSNDKDVGLVIERGSDTNVAVIWDESANQFALINTTETGSTSGDVTIASYADLTLKRVTQSEQQYTTSNMMKFNQYYLGNAIDSYFDPNEYQKVLTITPAASSENYQVSGRIMAQNAGDIHIVYFTAALRSGTLPDLSWSYSYTEEYNGSRYIDPQLWTKETTTAGFIVAFKVLARIYGTVTVDIDVIPRSSSLKANVAMNTSASSEQTTIDTGFTANDMTKVSTQSGTNITHVGSVTASAFFGDGSSLTGISSNYGDSDVATYLSSNGYGTSSSIIASITDSAPGTLDTLNELAAALGDDANFSTTVTNSIATKAPLASPALTGIATVAGTVEISPSTSYDPTGGGAGTDTATDVAVAFPSGNRIVGTNDGYIRTIIEWNSSSDIQIGQGGTSLIGGIDLLPGSSGNAKVNGNRILTTADEGTGNGLDADTVDGIQASSFLRSDADDTKTGNIVLRTSATVTSATSGLFFETGGTYTDGRYRTRFRKQDVGGGIPLYIDQSESTANSYTAQARFGTYSGNSYEFEVFGDINATGNLYNNGNAVWHAGNDGSGSGLDADTLDGMQPASTNTASTVVSRDASGNFSAGTITATATTAQYADLAENYLADAEYPIGTVLEIGGDAEVTIASPQSYKIVGTVSEAPGLLMNTGLEGEHVVPVAYIGRVPCRVQGNVNRGDFLVVGNTPGVAVAEHPMNILMGAAIGKALENHDSIDEGIIEILVGRL